MGNAFRTGRRLFLIGLLMLAGCSQGAGSLPYAIDISEERAGRIKADTPFDADSIAVLMPGFEVSTFTAFIEGRPRTLLVVTRHSKPVMSIVPTDNRKQIASVTVHHREVTAQKSFRIGDVFSAIFTSTDSCKAAEQEQAGNILCEAPNSQHIYYLFSSSRPSDVVPPMHELKTWHLSEIIWKSDA